MAISTSGALGAPKLTIRDMIAAMPLLMSWRNSKGRIMPTHGKSFPGVGKTMIPRAGVRSMARSMPGVPCGMGIQNPGVKTPADVAGFVLFDTIDGQKTSTYTRPDLFSVPVAITYVGEGKPGADSKGFVESFTDDAGQPIYWGSTVNGERVVNGLMVFDEFDQADAEIRKVLAPCLDEGRITSHTLPAGIGVWAFSNRAQEASGTGRGLAFLTNRWSAFEITPEIDGLEAYLRGEDAMDNVETLSPTLVPVLDARGRIVRNPHDVDSIAHPAIMAYMRQNQDALFAGVPADPNTPFLTPRSLEALSNLFDVCLRLSVADESGAMAEGLSFKDSFIQRKDAANVEGVTGDPAQRWRVFQALAAGTIGAENTAQFLATLELFDEVPTISEIVADPKKCPVSDKKDAQFICAHQIANAMNRRNADALMDYGKRLGPAMYHNIVHNAVARDGEVLMAASIAKFLQDHPDSMMRMMVMRSKSKVAGK